MRKESIIRKDLVKLINKFERIHIAVLGDIICDRFVYGDVERISPEAPVPVVKVRSEEMKVGGAGNVAHNIAMMGGNVHLFGVVGEDTFGGFLTSELARIGIDTTGVSVVTQRMTTLKTRIMSKSQHLLRIDRENTESIPRSSEDKIISALESLVPKIHILVISDYAKGVCSKRVSRRAIELFRKARKPIICDPKPSNLQLFKGVSLITPNREEAFRSAGINRVEGNSILKAATWLKENLLVEAVMITSGADGIFIYDRNKLRQIPAVEVEVYDVVGAGDTVCATTALAIGAGANYLTAAILANIAGGLVVSKLGLATVSREELLGALHSPKTHLKSS